MPESAPHVGSGVLVVGMHRSGTSAVTEMLHRAGLVVPGGGGAVDAHVTNPRGHWESRRLATVNDDLLAALGGTWSEPPTLEQEWESGGAATALVDRARTTFRQEHPRAPWVWKDPRNSVTLSFWRRALGDRPVLLIHRDPRAVAASLRLRNGFSIAHGVALWAVCLRETLRSAAGLPVLVVDWNELRTDPGAHAASIASWVGNVLPGHACEVQGMDAAIDREIGDHQDQVDATLPPDILNLHHTLRELDGAHDAFPAVPIPDLDPWVTAVVEERRRGELEKRAVERTLDDRIRALEAASQTLWSPGRVARVTLGRGRELGRRMLARRTTAPAPKSADAVPGDGPWLGEDLVFLVGQPRSGTTFVARTLGAHPAVAYWEEPELLQLARVLRAEIAERSGRVTESAIDPVTAPTTPLRDQGAKPAADPLPIVEARRVVGRLCAAFMAGTGATRVIDKTPGAIGQLAELNTLLPKAKAIVLVRDPRDVAASSVEWLDKNGAPEWLTSAADPVEEVARLWHLRMQIAIDASRTLPPDRLMTIRYEDFVAQPTVVGAQLLAFIELEWHPRCDAFLSRPDDGGLDRSRVGRWRSVLTPTQESTVVELNSRLMAKFGYEREPR